MAREVSGRDRKTAGCVPDMSGTVPPVYRNGTRTYRLVYPACMRSRSFVAVAAAIAAVAAPASAHAEDFTKKALTIPVVVGPKDDTKCNVSANLFTPAGV